MRNKYVFVIVMLICLSLLCGGFTKLYLVSSNEQLKEDETSIVTSFYPMYIAMLNITEGVEGIRLTNLSEPQTGCLHDFTLTPEDMKLLSTADIFVINGGGIEGFMKDVASAYPKLNIVEACQDVELLSEEDEVNAHAWMSVKLYMSQIDSITNQLVKIDGTNADKYLSNAKIYKDKLIALQEKQNAVVKAGGENENIVIFHEAFDYVACDYGMKVCGVMDLDEERQISAGEVADIINIINDNDVKIVLAEASYGSDMGATVEKETNVRVIYLDPLNRGEYDKDAYLRGMEENIKLLAERE